MCHNLGAGLTPGRSAACGCCMVMWQAPNKLEIECAAGAPGICPGVVLRQEDHSWHFPFHLRPHTSVRDCVWIAILWVPNAAGSAALHGEERARIQQNTCRVCEGIAKECVAQRYSHLPPGSPIPRCCCTAVVYLFVCFPYVWSHRAHPCVSPLPLHSKLRAAAGWFACTTQLTTAAHFGHTDRAEPVLPFTVMYCRHAGSTCTSWTVGWTATLQWLMRTTLRQL